MWAALAAVGKWLLANPEVPIAILGWFGITKQVKGSKRAQKILDIARDAFGVIEIVAKTKGWTSVQKWTYFLEIVTADMVSQGLGKPSDKEVGAIEAFVKERAKWDGKLAHVLPRSVVSAIE